MISSKYLLYIWILISSSIGGFILNFIFFSLIVISLSLIGELISFFSKKLEIFLLLSVKFKESNLLWFSFVWILSESFIFILFSIISFSLELVFSLLISSLLFIIFSLSFISWLFITFFNCIISLLRVSMISLYWKLLISISLIFFITFFVIFLALKA